MSIRDEWLREKRREAARLVTDEDIRQTQRIDPGVGGYNDVFLRDDGVVEIVLRDRAYKQVARALIDAADFTDAVRSEPWHRVKPHRVTYCRGASGMYLHGLLMNPPPGMVVDHINGDGLDCRRANLRVCTPSENALNTHVHRGEAPKRARKSDPNRRRNVGGARKGA